MGVTGPSSLKLLVIAVLHTYSRASSGRTVPGLTRFACIQDQHRMVGPVDSVAQAVSRSRKQTDTEYEINQKPICFIVYGVVYIFQHSFCA